MPLGDSERVEVMLRVRVIDEDRVKRETLGAVENERDGLAHGELDGVKERVDVTLRVRESVGDPVRFETLEDADKSGERLDKLDILARKLGDPENVGRCENVQATNTEPGEADG